MAYETEQLEFVSFTDGTSLPHAKCKVSIQAQVLTDESLSWFLSIGERIADHIGELKSSRAAEMFFTLADREKRTVSAGLRKVRIHITDPRTYYDVCKPALKKMLGPGETVLGFLRRLDSRQPIRNIQEVTRLHITKNIVKDSPAEQLRRRNEVLDFIGGRRLNSWMMTAELRQVYSPKPREAVDISIFNKSKSNPINQASVAVAKSASVFSVALEMASDASNYLPVQSRAIQVRAMLQSVTDSRAFDNGEPVALDFIREQQALVVREISPLPGVLSNSYELTEVDSKDFRQMQAADVAAGIARELWSRFGLVSLTWHFEHVRLNGMRLTENTARSHPFANHTP